MERKKESCHETCCLKLTNKEGKKTKVIKQFLRTLMFPDSRPAYTHHEKQRTKRFLAERFRSSLSDSKSVLAEYMVRKLIYIYIYVTM